MDIKVYIAGDILASGSPLRRDYEKSCFTAVNIPVYNPKDNESINDKAALKNETLLCDKILKEDTKQLMFGCSHVVIEPQPFAIGTMIELGQLTGYRQLSQRLSTIIFNMSISRNSASEILERIKSELDFHNSRKVYPHYQDARRVDGITETGDYRSLGINQYLVGACRYLTGGEPFYEFDDIVIDIQSQLGESK